MTENGGAAWAQTIFYPFMHASNYGRGIALKPVVKSDTYDTDKIKDIPYVETIGVYNEERGELTVFAVNRSLEENIDLHIDLRDFKNAALLEHIVMEHEDLKAVNSVQNPNNVIPHNNGSTIIKDDEAIATLKKHSWNVIRFWI
jgi:alpha-N-arabinofuranosidase